MTDRKPELRRDPISGRWVIISSARGKRPVAAAPRQEEESPQQRERWKRAVEQTAFIRPGRLWRPEIDSRIVVHEKLWRRISLSRYWLEAKLKRLIKEEKPDALMAWMPRGGTSKFARSFLRPCP